MKRLSLIILVFSGSICAWAGPPPDEMVADTVRELAGVVADCRLPLAADPVALRGVIDQHLRPKADVLYSGQLILGRHWGDADAAQRRRFAEALYGTLARRYAAGLLLLTDQNVWVEPGAPERREGEVQVELRVQVPAIPAPVPIFLQMRPASDRWRIYDGRWEGQSYVLGLRQAFAEEIRRDGLDSVIRRLEASAGEPPGIPEQRETAAGRCLRARAAR